MSAVSYESLAHIHVSCVSHRRADVHHLNSTLEALREAKRRDIETFFEEDGEPTARMDKRKALKIKDRA